MMVASLYYCFHASSWSDLNYEFLSSRKRLVIVKYDDENARHSAAGIAGLDACNSLSHETCLSSIERRRSARIPVRNPVMLSWQEGVSERVEAVFTTTISRFGCSVHSRMFLQPGTRIRLDFGDRTIEGRVVHSLKDHSTNVVITGLAFDQDGSDFWQVRFEFYP
jgi:PilZ domain